MGQTLTVPLGGAPGQTLALGDDGNLVWIAARKDGEKGPRGNTGPEGPAGPPGTSSTSENVSMSWIGHSDVIGLAGNERPNGTVTAVHKVVGGVHTLEIPSFSWNPSGGYTGVSTTTVIFYGFEIPVFAKSTVVSYVVNNLNRKFAYARIHEVTNLGHRITITSSSDIPTDNDSFVDFDSMVFTWCV